MKRISLLVLSLFSLIARSYCQQTKTTFLIQGFTKRSDTGRMFLMPVNTEDYYPSHGTMIATVLDGRFTFTDSISYPIAYMLGLKHDSNWQYLSNPFFVERGVQALYCNIDSLWETPKITNQTMHEFQTDFSVSFSALRSQSNQYDETRDSLNKEYHGRIPDTLNNLLSIIQKGLIQKEHDIYISYVKKNPGSYVALWKLIMQLSNGYQPFYDSLYNVFSDTIKRTYTGMILKQKLDMGRTTCIGCRFPDVKFAPVNDLSQKVSLLTRISKYTLIDIWFSHCAPCIEQFPEYKKLYERFRNSGFQLIGVSTDGQDQIQNWKQVIDENKLPWPQYLDRNGIVASQLSINRWPSNFLIDENGIIIQKNISPDQLNLFLTANTR
jgi:peroxiredoxin